MEETNEAKIGRYLSGEMTNEEYARFEQEVTNDDGLRASLADARQIWQHQSAITQYDWDTERAWQRFSGSLNHEIRPGTKTRRLMLAWSMAAAAVLVIGVYSFFVIRDAPRVYTFKEGSADPIVLSDGSRIFLNKLSEVTVYPFSAKKRHVELKGEAFFEVTPDKKRPFTITTDETVTEVVGTSFNIRQSAGQTQIFVNSGKIIFSSLKDEKKALALNEGEAAIFEAEKMIIIPNPSPNVIAWRTSQLRFVKMPLSSVIADVSAYFDEQIVIENEASKNCSINIPISFKKPEISSVLNAVAASINAKLVKEGNTYIIRGGRACP